MPDAVDFVEATFASETAFVIENAARFAEKALGFAVAQLAAVMDSTLVRIAELGCVGLENLATFASAELENPAAIVCAGQMAIPVTASRGGQVSLAATVYVEQGNLAATGPVIPELETPAEVESAEQENSAAFSVAGQLAGVVLVIPETETGPSDVEEIGQSFLLETTVGVLHPAAVTATEPEVDGCWIPAATVVLVNLGSVFFGQRNSVAAVSVVVAAAIASAVLHFAAESAELILEAGLVSKPLEVVPAV